jgi:hypothetical protein
MGEQLITRSLPLKHGGGGNSNRHGSRGVEVIFINKSKEMNDARRNKINEEST